MGLAWSPQTQVGQLWEPKMKLLFLAAPGPVFLGREGS